MKRFFGALLFTLALGTIQSASLASASSALGGQEFALRDFLNRTWRNEVVEFPLDATTLEMAKNGMNLVGPDGKPVLYQIEQNGPKNSAKIAFLADLDPFESRAYGFTKEKQSLETDLKIEETENVLRLSNGKVGLAIRKELSAGEGPIESVQLTSGQWVGGSKLDTDQTLLKWSAEVTARGPVYAEVFCRAEFSGGGIWEIKFRVTAGEPVVLVDEKFSVDEKAKFIFSLASAAWSPDMIFWRSLTGLKTIVLKHTQTETPVFGLRAWALWGFDGYAKWFGAYSNSGSDLLMIGARDADVWVDPAVPASDRTPPPSFTRLGDNILGDFSLKKGERRWMIGAFGKEASLALLKESDKRQTPLPQEYIIKYEFPLNRVKDYTLKWQEQESHPRLFLKPDDLTRIKQLPSVDPAVLARARVIDLAPENDSANFVIPIYLTTGDPILGKRLAEAAMKWMQDAVDYFLKQNTAYSFGAAPHNMKTIQAAVNLADAIFDTDLLSAKQKERLRAQAAFLGYTVTRNDYWSEERGYSCLPNMSTTVAIYQTSLGCFVASHPRARYWAQEGLTELKRELNEWSDENGGWEEAPHYAMSSYEDILGGFLMGKNSGYSDDIFDPKMKKVVEWFAKISTPPDSRNLNLRHLPPIGNTYFNEPSGEFGLVAKVWKERDPEFASQMEWMFRQQGAQPFTGVGGFGATFSGYRPLLLDPSIPEKAPAYRSELFPDTGVILRDVYPSTRETMLYMIAGKNHSHYDADSGSVLIWGKGRIVADDWGYNSRAPIEDSNMIETPGSTGNGMQIMPRDAAFISQDVMDYVQGFGEDGWMRQIVFVKGSNPIDPSYFVVSDSLRQGGPATWRMWFWSDAVRLISPIRALVEGREDVDTDVQFLVPTDVELRTQLKTVTPVGLNTKGQYVGKISLSQTGLIATGKNARAFTVLIYPRLRDEKGPVVTSLADGRGAKIESPSGTDYVFVSSGKPFEYKNGDIEFAGTIGVIQLRKSHHSLSLAAGGKISAGGHKLESDGPATKQW